MSAARKNGLTNEGLFLKWDKGKYAGIESFTMKTRLCLLFCSTPYFNVEFRSTQDRVFELPTTLQQLICVA